MRNETFKRMFENVDCSDEGREILAACIGKSVSECRIEWIRQYKVDLVLSDRVLPVRMDAVPFNGRYRIEFEMKWITDTDYNAFSGDSSVNIEMVNTTSSYRVTIEFRQDEIDSEFLNIVERKIRFWDQLLS